MKTEIERAPFEAWAKNETARVNLTLAYYPENHSTYKFTRTQHLFEGWLAREAQAPVPPAGDVEVLGYRDHVGNLYPTLESVELYGRGRSVRELVDRAHVTRLTAERDGLLTEVERLGRRVEDEVATAVANELLAERDLDALQSELTKARDLLAEALAGSDSMGWSVAEKIKSFIAHQSAPAAKGEPDA